VSATSFLGFPDWAPERLLDLLELAADLKAGRATGSLRGKVIALYFQNPSLRTRASLESAAFRLGAHPIALNAGAGTWDVEHRDGVVMDGPAQEHVREGAPVLARYADAIGVRAFPRLASWEEEKREPVLSAFARHARCPVFSMEGAARHPLQGLADALTLQERLGDPRGQRFVLTWAPHPKPLPMSVPNSAVEAAALLGMEVVVARPDGFGLDPEVLGWADALARSRGGSVRETTDRDAAFAGARAVYAKSWGGLRWYGEWAREAEVRAQHRHWTLRAADLERGRDPFFLHCLPVRRNVVVEDAVLDGPRSAVVDEAENRLWTAMALLLRLLRGGVQREDHPAREGPLLA
jgi:N-acetylornithine carbamoyltransferase